MEEDRDILKGETEKLKFLSQGQQRDSKEAKFQWKLQPCACLVMLPSVQIHNH